MRPHYRLLAIVLGLAAALRLLWLADTSFLIDQALLLERALDDNARHAFTTFGLRGTRGLDYGPLAVWLFRGILALKADVVFLVIVRTLFVSGLTAVALLWLARLCGFLLPWVAVVPMMSPYLWYWARDPWDNSLMIPFVALALASYLAFDREEKRWPLAITALSLCACFLLHLMSLPLIAALGTHFVVFHRPWLRRHPAYLAGLAVVALAIVSPYLAHLATSHPGGPPPRGALAAVGFSFCGPVQLSAIGFERYLGPGWFSGNALTTAATFLTGLAYLFCWYGLYLAVKTVRGAGPRDARWHLCWLVAVGFAFHFALNVKMHLFSFPHYYNGVWIFFFAMLWLAATELWKKTAGRVAFTAYAASLAISLASAAWMLHANGGSRQLSYGPTLANWIRLAKTIPPDADLVTEAFHPKVFPNILPTLQKIYAPTAAGAKETWVLRYHNPQDPRDGRIDAVRIGR